MSRLQKYLSEFDGSGPGYENTERQDEENEMFYNEAEDLEVKLPETDNQHNTFRRQTEQGAVSTYDKDMDSDLKEDIGSSSPGRNQTSLQPSTEDLELEQFGGSGTNTDLEKEDLDLSEGELKMYKQYLSTIVEDLVRNDKTINPKDCVSVIKELKSMDEKQCKEFLKENFKLVLNESTNFKKKVSDHIAPSPQNQEHMKKDARPSSKYSKQKREVHKMIGGIKKKFREQVAYSIIQSLKDVKV